MLGSIEVRIVIRFSRRKNYNRETSLIIRLSVSNGANRLETIQT